jgi:hypothetical protein
VISACNRPAHITSGADFLTILANVGKCLNPQGFFLFYLYSETAYASRWNGSFSKIEDVCIVNASYNSKEKMRSQHFSAIVSGCAQTFSSPPAVTRQRSSVECFCPPTLRRSKALKRRRIGGCHKPRDAWFGAAAKLLKATTLCILPRANTSELRRFCVFVAAVDQGMFIFVQCCQENRQ